MQQSRRSDQLTSTETLNPAKHAASVVVLGMKVLISVRRGSQDARTATGSGTLQLSVVVHCLVIRNREAGQRAAENPVLCHVTETCVT